MILFWFEAQERGAELVNLSIMLIVQVWSHHLGLLKDLAGSSVETWVTNWGICTEVLTSISNNNIYE